MLYFEKTGKKLILLFGESSDMPQVKQKPTGRVLQNTFICPPLTF